MNKNLVIVIAGGILVAVLVALLMSLSLSGGKKKPKKAEAVNILVAAKEIKQGEEIKPESVQWKSYPKSSVFEGMVQRENKDQKAHEARPGKASRRIVKGEPITANSILEGTGMLAAKLTEGMRAVAIDVKASSTAGGFVAPSDRVDVILTYKIRMKNSDNPELAGTVQARASETVLEDVRVLAVDQSAERKEDKVKVGRTVTLEVSPEDAEKLTLASSMGDLSLSLRAFGDDTKRADFQKNYTTDVGVSKILQRVTEMQNENSAPTNRVRIYNGQDVQTTTARP